MSNIIINHNGDYGCPILRNLTQPQRELFGYCITRGKYGRHLQHKLFESNDLCLGDFKFLSPVEHLINFVRIGWPTEVSIESRGYVNKPMIRIWEELCECDDVGIAGNAGSSKSFGAAVFLNVDWMSAPDVTSSFLASTTFEASEQRMWGHVSNLYKSCKYKVGTFLDYKKSIVQQTVDPNDPAIRERDYINSIKALAFPSGNDGRKAVDTTRGRHNMRVRMFIDEMAEMEQYVLRTKSNLSANLDFIFCGIANPMPGENPHRELCQPADSRKWDSVNPSVKKWKTRTGTCIFLHGEESPNFEAPENEPPPFPFLQTRDSLSVILKNAYGNRNSLDYFRNAIGFWPPDVIQTTVISRSNIEMADIGNEPIWQGDKLWLATLDCAQTAGGDRNILSFGFLGNCREDRRRVAMFKGQKGYVVNVGEEFEQSLAKQVVEDLEKIGVEPENFGMDISGDGGKILSAIIQEWIKKNPNAARVVGISSGGKPTERMASGKDNRKAREVYDRLVTEYAFSMYHLICDRLIFGLSLRDTDDELISELCSREFLIKGGKMSVETKAEMKSRMGKSPDKSDSLIYFGELARRRGLAFLSPDEVRKSKPFPFQRERDKPKEVYTYSGGSSDSDGF